MAIETAWPIVLRSICKVNRNSDECAEVDLISNFRVFHALPREDKGDRGGIPNTHPIQQVIRLELFLESG